MEFSNMNFKKIFALLMKILADQEGVEISYELIEKERTEDDTAS